MNILSGKKPAPSPQQPQPRSEPPTPVVIQRKQYDPAALNFAQRMVENEAEIEHLKLDVENWRAKAAAYNEQVERLKAELTRVEADRDQHIEKLNAQHANEVDRLLRQGSAAVDKLTDERDHYKLRYTRTVERLQIAGKVILDTLQEREERLNEVDSALKAVADAVGISESGEAHP